MLPPNTHTHPHTHTLTHTFHSHFLPSKASLHHSPSHSPLIHRAHPSPSCREKKEGGGRRHMSEEERKRDAQHPQRWKVRCWHQTGRRCEWGNKWRSLQRRREENRNWDTRWKGYRGVKMHFWHGKKEIRRKLIQCWCIKLVMSVRSGLEILKIRHSFFFKKSISSVEDLLCLLVCTRGEGGPDLLTGCFLFRRTRHRRGTAESAQHQQW